MIVFWISEKGLHVFWVGIQFWYVMKLLRWLCTVLSCHVRPDVSLTSGLTSALRSSDEDDETAGSITRLRFVWFTWNFVHLPPHNPLENRVCHASNVLQIFFPKILSDEKPDEIQRKWCIMRVYKKTTYKRFTQLHLSNWPIRNYFSVQFLMQTLSGNTLVVGTKSIPSVSSAAKHTGSGLLQQWCRGARALVQWIHCTTARAVHVQCTWIFLKKNFLKKKIYFFLILNRKSSCWLPTFLMKRVLCICNGCGILETKCLASTNVN